MDINLSTLSSAQGFRILSEGSDYGGWAVSSAGDINGDGYDDVIIGANSDISGAAGSYVIFGKASGFSDISLSTLSSDQGFRMLDETSGDQCGRSVSGAGDINRDGYADVITGALGPSSDAGKSYVVFGKASGFGDINLSALSSPQGFTILAETSGDDSGYSVSSAGDVNGDGYADIIIGAPAASGGAGKSYVIFGKASGFSDVSLSTLSSAQGFRILGENSGDGSGHSVSGAGDVNKDGFSDIVVGAVGASGGAGKSYVIFGKASGFSDISLSTLSSAQGFRILGENSDDLSGWSVSSAGDVNGDGYDDVIIGASQSYLGYGTGKSYVIFGKANGFNDISLSTLSSTQGFRILGESNDISGYSVSSAGDVNADGYADIIIGAPGPGGAAGKSYVVFGKISGFSDISLSTLNSTADFRILGENRGDFSGWSVSGGGDVNSDGYADIIIGAEGAGKSYVIFGKATVPNENTSSSSSNADEWKVIGGVLGSVLGILVIAGVAYAVYKYCNICKQVPLVVQKIAQPDTSTMPQVEGQPDGGIDLAIRPQGEFIAGQPGLQIEGQPGLWHGELVQAPGGLAVDAI